DPALEITPPPAPETPPDGRKVMLAFLTGSPVFAFRMRPSRTAGFTACSGEDGAAGGWAWGCCAKATGCCAKATEIRVKFRNSDSNFMKSPETALPILNRIKSRVGGWRVTIDRKDPHPISSQIPYARSGA